MSTITKEFTKEQLQQIIETDHVQCGEASALARIALASLEAEPVAYIFKHPAGRLFWALTDESNKGQSDVMPVYTTPPEPASVPDEDLLHMAASAIEDLLSNKDRYCAGVWADIPAKLRRAAMLQGADGNSPVIPDGWKLVPIDPTKDMLRAGQSVVGFWLNTVHCYSKMLAAAPAAPQQEVK